MLNYAISGLIWVIVGAMTSIIYFQSQRWSVHQLNLHNPHKGLRLIIGGTILRWVLFTAVITVAATSSFTAMFIVFITFMIVRLFYLLKWQGWLRIRKSSFNQY